MQVALDPRDAGRVVRGHAHRHGRDGQVGAAKGVADLQADDGGAEGEADGLAQGGVSEDDAGLVLCGFPRLLFSWIDPPWQRN